MKAPGMKRAVHQAILNPPSENFEAFRFDKRKLNFKIKYPALPHCNLEFKDVNFVTANQQAVTVTDKQNASLKLQGTPYLNSFFWVKPLKEQPREALQLFR
jgi:hypothetical protein